MIKFGQHPPRSLQSFGVSGLLHLSCHVYYSTLFSTRHLGRVSDLLAARFRAAGSDELRLRASLLFATYEMARAQQNRLLPDPKLTEPLVIECGVDAEKIAVGVSFTLPSDAQFDWNGLADRIVSGQVLDQREQLLVELNRFSHRFVVRFQASSRRMELVCLLGIPGRMSVDELSATPPPLIIQLTENTESSPEAQNYVELGDLDYPNLLKEDTLDPALPPSLAGDVIVRQAGTESDPAVVVRGMAGLEDVRKVVRGHKEVDSEKTLIAGVTDKLKKVFQKVGTAGGDATQVASGVTVNNIDVKPYLDQIEELKRQLARQKAAADQARVLGEVAAKSDGSESSNRGTVGGWIKKLLALGERRPRSRDESESLSSNDATEGESVGEETAPTVITETVLDEELVGKVQAQEDTIQILNGEIEALMRKLEEAKASASMTQVKERMKEVSGEFKTEKAKTFVEGLMSEVVSEKAQLQEVAKRLTVTVRQKELEFRNKERILIEANRKKDEQLRLKELALQRSKEQLAHSQSAAEKLKSSPNVSIEEANTKQKLMHAQRNMGVIRDENAQLKQRVEELRVQINTVQASAKAKASTTELTQIQTKYERTHRQLEDLRKVNQQLMDRLNDSQKDKGGKDGGAEELKKRLAAAMKMVSANKKDSERLSQKVEDLQKEELRLKMELNKATNELRKVRSKAAASGSGTGGTPAAA